MGLDLADGQTGCLEVGCVFLDWAEDAGKRGGGSSFVGEGAKGALADNSVKASRLKPQLLCVLLPKINQMTQALRLSLRHRFLHRCRAVIDPDHPAAKGLGQKKGAHTRPG